MKEAQDRSAKGSERTSQESRKESGQGPLGTDREWEGAQVMCVILQLSQESNPMRMWEEEMEAGRKGG